MFDFFSKYARLIGAVALLVLPFFILYANTRDPWRADPVSRVVVYVQGPLQRAVGYTVDTVLEIWRGYVGLVEVRRENAELQEQLAAARRRLVQLEAVHTEYERLTRLTAMRERLEDVEWVGAHVIGLELSPTAHVIRIDRGTADGVAVYMAVVAERGLIGRVYKAYTHAADVLLMNDVRSAVPARVDRTRTPLTVRGDGTTTLHVDHLDITEPVRAGDAIVTAALGELLPPGIPIGTLDNVRRGRNALFAIGEIRPAADLTRVEEVLVLMRVKPTEDVSYLPDLFRLIPARQEAAATATPAAVEPAASATVLSRPDETAASGAGRAAP